MSGQAEEQGQAAADDGLFRVSRIVLRAGSTPGAQPTDFQPGHVTVIVGPNNSGKSLMLREIESWATGNQTPPVSPWPGGTVVASIDGVFPADEAALRAALAERAVPDQENAENHLMIYSFAPEAGGGGP